MQVQVIVNSACALKNVNWRNGMLHPYAVVWIDTSRKCSTKVDMKNGMNPVWDEKFNIALPLTSFPETAILYIDIVHANATTGTKPLVGSVRFPLSAVLNEARANGKVSLLCLNLMRPSGRPQGSIEINIGLKDLNIGQVNQYNQQQPPYKQHAAAQPLPQVQMQPQRQFKLQHQVQPRPQVQPQGQFQPRPQVIPQGQYQPRPVVQLQGQYQHQPQVQPQGKNQHQPQVLPQGQYQHLVPQVLPQGQSQPRPRSQPHPKLQPQVQPMNKYSNNPAPVKPVVHPPNSNGPIRPTAVQRPRNSVPDATNRPAYYQVNPVPVQQQYNPTCGMVPLADVARLNRDMPIAQTQQGQLPNNVNSNAAPGAAGLNDSGETKGPPGADNTVDNSNTENVEEKHSAETFNDAESIYISYDETPGVPVGSDDNGGYDYGEYATEEYDNGGNNANAGAVEYANQEYHNEGYDANAGVECDNGGNNANAGAVEYANQEYHNEGYDANAGVECDNGGYVNEQCDVAFDGAGLESRVDCEEEDVSCDY